MKFFIIQKLQWYNFYSVTTQITLIHFESIDPVNKPPLYFVNWVCLFVVSSAQYVNIKMWSCTFILLQESWSLLNGKGEVLVPQYLNI